MGNFTKGPWMVIPGSEFRTDVGTAEGHYENGEPMYWNVASANRLRDEYAANKSLIAAAPDLYDAAYQALNVLIACSLPVGGVDDAREINEATKMLMAALAKADGNP